MDTDALLKPLTTTENQLTAWQEVVKANTEALKEIRVDLGQCNNQEKVQAIIYKAEAALQDLCADSQKIPGWVRQPAKRGEGNVETIDVNPNLTVSYGQYPVHNPTNRDNPVLAAADMPAGAGVSAVPEKGAKR